MSIEYANLTKINLNIATTCYTQINLFVLIPFSITVIENNGQFALIDAGDCDDDAKVKSYLKNQEVTGLEYLIITHFHANHFGDAESQVEATLTTIGDVDLFKAGHHGSSTSNTASLLNRITPEHVVIMAGANNQYGHPDAEVMDRFKNLGIPVYRTDEQGTIIVTLSEEGVSVNKEPGSYQAGKQTESSSSTSNSSSGSSSSNTSSTTSSP
ncbi:MBL fold metallo-hydrolase, partial [Turicibacter sp.]|uniref:ComEC/Rec2 family competence protein n=1 Tax=Turicibacter sp. TaxID=2049042 RepID=UPI001B57FBA6